MTLQTLNRHEQDIPKVTNEDSLFAYRTHIETILTNISADFQPIGKVIEATLSPQQVTWLMGKHSIRKLEKRFILRGDLAVKNEPLMSDLTELQTVVVGTYLLEALNNEYSENNDLNSLNTAVRLTDYILSFSHDNIIEVTPLRKTLSNLLVNLEALADG